MKLTKKETKLHDEAVQRLAKDDLNDADRDFVYMHWLPGANHNVGRDGIFFTPLSMAHSFAVWAKCTDRKTRYLDLCAGMGVMGPRPKSSPWRAMDSSLRSEESCSPRSNGSTAAPSTGI